MTESKKTGLAFFNLTEKDKIKPKKDKRKVNFIIGKDSSSKLSKLKPIVESPIQTKIIAAISILLLFGGIIHTFMDIYAPDRPLIKIIMYSLICVIVLGLLYLISNDNNELWAILLSVCISFLLWFYVFYKEWKEIQDAVQSGEHSFICNPVGKCKTDNFHGLYSSEKNYKYKDEGTNNKIPSTALDITNQEQATYMFWCNVSYKVFSDLYNKEDNIIIEHGNNITTYLSSLDPKIQFKIDDDTYMETNYSFDNWTHYCITMNGKVVELYKNASLEKTFVLKQNKQITKTDMSITGEHTTIEDKKKPLYKLAFLTFANSVYTPEKIYDIYNNQYNTIAYEYDTNACVECENPEENTEDTECVKEDTIAKIQESCEAIQSSLQTTASGTSQTKTSQTQTT